MIEALSRADWRAWLEDNHATKTEVWLVYYKKHTGKNYIGWLQGAKKPETRAKRLKELISVLEQNKKLGMK